MAKFRVLCFLMTAAVGISLATAQTSGVRSSSLKQGSDPLKAATKPLTPKSAMPPRHKASIVQGPHQTPKGRSTNAELTRLEHQNIKAGGSNTRTQRPSNGASVRKSSDASARKGSGIDFKYQKPAGGMQATTPSARSANSSTPRVPQKN